MLLRALAVAAALIVSLPFSEDLAAQTWRSVGKSQGNETEFAIDVDSVRQAEGGVSAWTRERFSRPQFRGLFQAPGHERLVRNVIDCGRGTSSIAQWTIRGESGDVLESVQLRPSEMRPSMPVPGSIGAAIVRMACDTYSSRADQQKNYDPNDPPQDSFHKFTWRFVANSNDRSAMYIGADSFRRGEGRQASIVYLLTRSDRPAVAGSAGGVTVTRVVVDCADRLVLFGNSAMFDQSGAFQGRALAKALEPAPIRDGSIAEQFMKLACSEQVATGSAPAPDPTSTPSQRTPAAQSTPSETARQSGSFGTAWLSDVGYLVTAFHVVDGAGKITVVLPDRSQVIAQIVSTDRANDIAILSAQLPPLSLRAFSIAKSPAAIGAQVFTTGFPHPEVLGVNPKFTGGDVSATSGLGDDPRILQVSVPVQSGNSGGPLVNQAGEVVGVISSKLSAVNVLKRTGDLPQNVNYAVKARYVQGLLTDLPPRSLSAPRVRASSPEVLAAQMNMAVFLILAE